MKSPQENPEKNAPSPNRKVAEDAVREGTQGTDAEDCNWSGIINSVVLALDAKDAEAREKVERVKQIISCRPCCGKTCSHETPDRHYLAFDEDFAAANEMREGEK